MIDRDTFAAAALTGLLSNIPRYQLGVIAVQAYDIADEMLRERLRNGATDGRETVQSDRPSGVSSAWAEAANQQLRERGHYGASPRSTTHDAVPEAKAMQSRDCSGVLSGTGDTPTLTDEERKAIEIFAKLEWTSVRWSAVEEHAATLRKLLERMK